MDYVILLIYVIAAGVSRAVKGQDYDEAIWSFGGFCYGFGELFGWLRVCGFAFGRFPAFGAVQV
jgi:hypothetical protein